METSQAKTMKMSADRIGSLPDSLIHRILSFTDMKYAVQTSALSARWRSLWLSLPFLNFNSSEFHPRPNPPLENTSVSVNNARFMDFVNNVLMVRDTCDILKFSLVDNIQGIPVGRLHLWITSALRHNLQELHLFINTHNQHFQLPHLLFSCKSLVKLRTRINLVLQPVHKLYDFDLPDSISLPKLKTIDLSGVCFTNQNLTNKLFSTSTCPVLESLSIKYSVADSVRDINIITPHLKHLVIVRSITGAQYACKININAPNLMSLTVEDYIARRYNLEAFPSLDYAHINLIQLHHPAKNTVVDNVERARNFLIAVCNARTLTLSPALLELVKEPFFVKDFFALSERKNLQFTNMRYLKLNTWLSSDDIQTIMSILKASPNLLSLVLIKKGSLILENVEEYQAAKHLLPFMLPQLKFVEIRDVRGTPNELRFIEYVLQTSLILEKIILYKVYEQSPERRKNMTKFSEKLLNFPQASSRTSIFLLD